MYSSPSLAYLLISPLKPRVASLVVTECYCAASGVQLPAIRSCKLEKMEYSSCWEWDDAFCALSQRRGRVNVRTFLIGLFYKGVLYKFNSVLHYKCEV